MLPLRDTAASRRAGPPFALITIVALNLLVFLWEALLPVAHLPLVVISYGLIPALVASEPLSLLPSGLPVLATLVTSQFLHAGALHLAGNLVFLWVFGDRLESALGHLTFTAVYLMAGVGAALAHVALFAGSNVPSMGASGAVSGVLAGYLLLFPRATVRTLLLAGPFLAVGRVRALALITVWLAIQAVQGALSLSALPFAPAGVGYVAHLGGFVSGAALVGMVRAARGQTLGQFHGAFAWGWTFRNWAIAALLLALLAGISAVVETAVSPQAAVAVRAAGACLAAALALTDGLRRLTGHSSPFMPVSRSGRWLAVVQMVMALSLLATMLLTVAVL